MINVQLINNFAQGLKDSDVDSQREKLFTKLIDGSATSRLVEEEPVDFYIYFDTDLLASGKEQPITELLTFKDEEGADAIFDVTQDVFNDEQLGSVLTLCVVCAGFVTCSSAEVQEAIYNATGRLAYMVENPILDETMKEADSNETKAIGNPYILWFGMANEIFTVRQQQVENTQFNINTIILNDTSSDKIIDNAFSKADIIYLPKTFDDLGERNRGMKVQLSLLEGKFVVAPDLPVEYKELAMNGSLMQGIEYYQKFDISKWIKKKQETLLANSGLANSLEQFVKALELAPTDAFLDNIDYFLESEENLV